MKRISGRRHATLALLLLAGASLHAQSPSDALRTAVRERNVARVGELLAKGADANAASPTGETALHAAAQADDVALARKLIAAGAKPAANRYGVTPLALACERGNAEMAGLLIDAGADTNAPMRDGRTPLMVAAQTGRVALVNALLAKGAQADAKEPEQNQTALMWAAAEGHRETVAALLKSGVDFKAKSKGGYSALHFAVREGHGEIVRTLLAAGADVSDPIGERTGGASALSLAVTNGRYELGAMLLEAGADPNYTWQGRTVLHILTWVRRPGQGSNAPAPAITGSLSDLDFVRLLAKKGADVNRRMTSNRNGPRTVLNLTGATPFLLAARTADVELMRLLVELGADPKIPNADDSTPLIVAAGLGVFSPGEDPGNEAEVFEAVKLAVELGNDVNAVDKQGNTAMHGVAFKWSAPCVPYLVEKGAKLEIWNRKNQQGWTPLRIATGVHRTMNFRASPSTAAELKKVMAAAGVSTEVEPEPVISGATK